MLSKTKYSFWHWCLGRRKAEPAILLVLCSSRASPPGCWHAKGFPEVSVSFLPAGTGSGGVWGHRHVDECPAGRVCCKRAAGAPRLVRWRAALCACAFPGCWLPRPHSCIPTFGFPGVRPAPCPRSSIRPLCYLLERQGQGSVGTVEQE